MSLFSGCEGVKGQNVAHNGNNSYIRVAPYLWNSIAGGHDFLVHLCKMIISPGYFFIFDIFILGLLGGEGGGRAKN